jgi:hypothetical protein
MATHSFQCTHRALNRLLITMGFVLTTISATSAGTWGQESWGQMYWGDNPVSAPVTAPTVSVEVDGADFIALVSGYTEGNGNDGWSVIVGYSISCSNESTLESASPVLSVSDLEPDTDYTCSVVATNAQGSSPQAFFTQRTGLNSTGLPVWLLYRASQERP